MTLNTFDSTVYLPLYSTAPLGVHAMCVEGYDLPKQLFLVKNSFGKNWGDNGYCYIPFEYMTKESFDRWIFDIEDKSHLLID
jgi:C1A family cysteine protease